MKKNNAPEATGPMRRMLPVQLRATGNEDGSPRTIQGHGAVFGQLSEDLGGFREIIHPGAFDGVVERSDICCLVGHDPDKILGRCTNGTGANLSVVVDEAGLAYTCTPSDTQYARDLIANLDCGNITQSSFAFDVDWSKEGPASEGGPTSGSIPPVANGCCTFTGSRRCTTSAR